MVSLRLMRWLIAETVLMFLIGLAYGEVAWLDNSPIGCSGDECNDQLFCYEKIPLRSKDISLMFSGASVSIKFDRLELKKKKMEKGCVMIESEDTYMLQSNIYHLARGSKTAALDVEERIIRKKKNFLFSKNINNFNDDERGPDFINPLDAIHSLSNGLLLPTKHALTCDADNQGKCRIDIPISAYGKSCFAICNQFNENSGTKVEVNINQSDINSNYMIMMASGLLLFFSASILSDRLIFYYISGISFGVVFSVFLLLTVLLGWILPKRSSYLISTALQSALIYFLTTVKNQWEDFLEANAEYVIYYLIATTILSLGLTHYFLKSDDGSISVSPGLKDIISLVIRSIALVLLYHATSSVSRSLFLVASASIYLLLSKISFLGRLNILIGRLILSFFRGIFSLLGFGGDRVPKLPKKYLYREKFLSEEEFELQSRIATDKAMENLFSSPGFKDWAIKNKQRISVLPFEHTTNIDDNFDDKE